MNKSTGMHLRWTVLIVGAAALLATGAGAAYFVLRSAGPAPTASNNVGIRDPKAAANASRAMPASDVPPDASLPDLAITLSREAVDRAGIVVAPIGEGESAGGLRLPGVVEPNAYRQVTVTPLVAGRITRVLVELGEQVTRGQTLAQVFSPELAEAQTRYTSARAELEAHERELARTQKLVEIGAASRQELERIHAEHTAQTAAVQSARSQLELLGISAEALDAGLGKGVTAAANVPAPIAGVVTERLANAGLNVESASKLFTVVDLSTVWVVADLYEKDFSRVRVGSPARVTTAAYPDVALEGRVSYIDPQLSAETRTAKVRVEVPNPRSALRLGMYADVQVSGTGRATVPVIPRSAVQTVGNRQVVYLGNVKEPGKFIEREVRLGPVAGGQVEILSGLHPGDVIVTEGSFFVRAERDRLGLRTSVPAAAAPSAAPKPRAAQDVQTAKVYVGEQGYAPAKLSLRAGIPARITFVRTTDKTCGTEVVFPTMNIRRALPLNEPVAIEFTPSAAGDIAFACGMNMLHGTIVVQ
jgi:RND family efflux transporter MFP subunit